MHIIWKEVWGIWDEDDEDDLGGELSNWCDVFKRIFMLLEFFLTMVDNNIRYSLISFFLSPRNALFIIIMSSVKSLYKIDLNMSKAGWVGWKKTKTRVEMCLQIVSVSEPNLLFPSRCPGKRPPPRSNHDAYCTAFFFFSSRNTSAWTPTWPEDGTFYDVCEYCWNVVVRVGDGSVLPLECISCVPETVNVIL